MCKADLAVRSGTMRVKPTTFSSAFTIDTEVLCPKCDCEKVRWNKCQQPASCNTVSFLKISHFCFSFNIRPRLKMQHVVTVMEIWCVGNASVTVDGITALYILYWLSPIIVQLITPPFVCTPSPQARSLL